MFRLVYIFIFAFSFGSLARASDTDIALERLTSLERYQDVIEELKSTEGSLKDVVQFL